MAGMFTITVRPGVENENRQDTEKWLNYKTGRDGERVQESEEGYTKTEGVRMDLMQRHRMGEKDKDIYCI